MSGGLSPPATPRPSRGVVATPCHRMAPGKLVLLLLIDPHALCDRDPSLQVFREENLKFFWR